MSSRLELRRVYTHKLQKSSENRDNKLYNLQLTVYLHVSIRHHVNFKICYDTS